MPGYKKLTKEKKAIIALLNKRIDTELEKPFEEANLELIDECNKLIFAVKELRLSRREIKKKVKAIIAPEKQIKRVNYRRVILIAVLSSILVVVSTLFVSSENDLILAEKFKEFVEKLVALKPGETVEYNSVTFEYAGNELLYYDTYEEFLEGEGKGKLYPGYMPDGVEIEKISYIKYEDQLDLEIKYSNPDYRYCIFKDSGVNLELLEKREITTIKGVDYYIYHIIEGDDLWQAFCIYNDYHYIVVAPTYEKLIDILNNMEGMTT